MPLARIRTHARELAVDLSEELYDLGYTVETISPGEYRADTADLEIELQACDPGQVVSLVARTGDEFKKVFVSEGVVDCLPIRAPVSQVPPPVPVQQPIALVEVIPAEVEDAPQPVVAAQENPDAVPPIPVIAAAESDVRHKQPGSGRTRRFAEFVASAGDVASRAGLYMSDKFDEAKGRLNQFSAEVARRAGDRADRIRVARERAAERKAQAARQRTVPVRADIPRPEPVGALRAETISTASQRYRRGDRSRPVSAPRRQTPRAFVLKVGAAVGLVGMMLVIGYANRRPATPVGLGELTRSTTVKQSAPFGSAEIKPPAGESSAAAANSAQPIPVTAQASSSAQTKKASEPKVPAKPAAKKRTAPADDYFGDEPEVVIRHHKAPSKPAVSTAQDGGIKRFSDLD